MEAKPPSDHSRRAVFFAALKYSVPVLLGYVTVGIAFGLMVSGAGYPWWLAFAMSFWMYAGAGQFIALGLFAAGTSLWQLCLIQLVVNVRHSAYGLSMLKRFEGLGIFKPYLVFSLTDETFALLSSIPLSSPSSPPPPPAAISAEEASVPGIPASEEDRRFFMVFVAVLDQVYWLSGSIIGAVAGALIPFDIVGIGFALVALFIVLMIEQIKRVKKKSVFVVSAIPALLGAFFLPGNISLLAALAMALLLSVFVERLGKERKS